MRLLVAAVVVAACIAATVALTGRGSERDARASASSPVRSLGANVARGLGIDPPRTRKAASFTTAAGVVHDIVLAARADGGECLLDIGPGGAGGGGCDADLFADQPVAWNIASDGGPTPERMESLRVAGVARPEVDRIEVVDSAGNVHRARLSGAAFWFELPRGHLRRGVDLTALLVYERSGEPTRISLADG